MFKKNVYVFLVKTYFICWTKLQNSKTFSNCQATHQKELYLLIEKSGILFSQSKHEDRLDPPPPAYFGSLFKDPPSPLHTLNVLFEGPLLLKKIKEAYRHKKKI